MPMWALPMWAPKATTDRSGGPRPSPGSGSLLPSGLRPRGPGFHRSLALPCFRRRSGPRSLFLPARRVRVLRSVPCGVACVFLWFETGPFERSLEPPQLSFRPPARRAGASMHVGTNRHRRPQSPADEVYFGPLQQPRGARSGHQSPPDVLPVALRPSSLVTAAERSPTQSTSQEAHEGLVLTPSCRQNGACPGSRVKMAGGSTVAPRERSRVPTPRPASYAIGA